jgi:DNA invertase Pin-like site-specific DNA recombinase
MLYGYARVSTIEQHLERQLNALKEEGVEMIYTDKTSGVNLERPELKRMLEDVKEGDTIIITDITRISRSTRDLFELVDLLKLKGVNLKSIKDTWLDLSSENVYSEFLLLIFSGLADLERKLLRDRQKEGIAIAKSKGVYKGRPKTFTLNNPRIVHAIELYKGGDRSVKEVCKVTNISEATFYRAWKKVKEEEGL